MKTSKQSWIGIWYSTFPNCGCDSNSVYLHSKKKYLSKQIYFGLSHLKLTICWWWFLMTPWYISVFSQRTIKKSTASILFRVLSVADTFTLILGPGQDSINHLAGTYGLENIHNVVCKVIYQLKVFDISNWILLK